MRLAIVFSASLNNKLKTSGDVESEEPRIRRILIDDHAMFKCETMVINNIKICNHHRRLIKLMLLGGDYLLFLMCSLIVTSKAASTERFILMVRCMLANLI